MRLVDGSACMYVRAQCKKPQIRRHNNEQVIHRTLMLTVKLTRTGWQLIGQISKLFFLCVNTYVRPSTCACVRVCVYLNVRVILRKHYPDVVTSKRFLGRWLDLTGLGYESAAGFCECGNESSGSGNFSVTNIRQTYWQIWKWERGLRFKS